ncbi:MAG: DUF2380 domain-containing protein [Steroidobacteraceae bacterium]
MSSRSSVMGRLGLWALGSVFPAACVLAGQHAPIKIAVFNFELDDVTPASALLDQSTSSSATLEKVTAAARKALADSGRYTIVDVGKANATPASGKTLRDCDGCEASIAAHLGAAESMIGVVRRATQTDFYITLVIRDANTGKVLDQQGANFAGDETGWPSGVRMLIKHQVLVTQN